MGRALEVETSYCVGVEQCCGTTCRHYTHTGLRAGIIHTLAQKSSLHTHQSNTYRAGVEQRCHKLHVVQDSAIRKEGCTHPQVQHPSPRRG
jgi:hypothetical protein